MIARRSLLAGFAGLAAMPQGIAGALAAGAGPSIRPGDIWPDDRGRSINAHGGGILKHGGHFWWFGEHKTAGEGGNRANVGVHCYSSTDLMRWRDEGIALAVSDDPTSDIARGCILERPKVIRNPRTGQFVMWFHLELKDQGYLAARAAVAVADRPAGPYRFLRSGRVNPGIWPVNATARDKAPVTTLTRDFAGGQMARDMTLFVDDDGTAYHLFASEENQTLHAAILDRDWTGHDGRYARILPGGANEAPAVWKARGRYYLFTSGTTGWKPNPARLHVADHMFGPWRSLGNPVRGTPGQRATTFDAQSTFVQPLPDAPDGRPRAIFMADRWRPENAIDGRYVWLPVDWEGDIPVLRWRDDWRVADA